MTATAKAKRVRQVWDTDHIPHLWAHQTQESARNACGNFYFRGDTIYSYGEHFPIARHLKFRGKACVLFVDHGYSVTTAKHVSLVRRAIPGDLPKFEVSRPDREPADNFPAIVRAVESARDDLAKAKNKAQRVNRFLALASAVATANEFSAFFKLGKRFKLPANAEALQAEADQYHQELTARREANEAKRSAKYRAERAERERIALLDSAELVAEWRAGLPLGHNHWRIGQLPTMLRIRGEMVETSRGVEFPIEHAQRAARLLLPLLASGRSYKRNGHTIHLGHYAIDSLDEQGTLTAGCHIIAKDELLAFAELLAKHTGETTEWIRVIVGNIGEVYYGLDMAKANEAFAEYESQSQAEYGRAAGEDVTLMTGEHIEREHIGRNSASE